ncbi:MAG: fasciclin domain-containing protein, partial [Gammaproteobacteria bacterium]|nr:fasciclin domain-containing protein [Gammaproteobacteria bacterium]NNF48263.1 fasciclin domain-containing protein [Woeseiaceae bacterium]
ARNLGYKGGNEGKAYDFIVAALTDLSGGDPIPLLKNILLYHVSAGSKYVKEVSKSGGIDTLLGATILPARTTLLDNDPDLKDARIIEKASNIKASNGIIHTISRVMIPLDILNPDKSSLPTITEIVLSSGGAFDHNKADYDILLNAVQAAGLADALNNPADSLTVLAPNDKAFIKTARDLGYHGEDEAGAFGFIVAALTDLGGGDPIPLLQAILLYHVVPAELTNKQILESDVVTTLFGEDISPDPLKRTLGDNEDALRDPFIYVFKFDNIRASNGFVQTIGRVLIPVDLSTL